MKVKIDPYLHRFIKSLDKVSARKEAMEERFVNISWYEQDYINQIEFDARDVKPRKHIPTQCHRVIGTNNLGLKRYGYAQYHRFKIYAS